MSINMDKLVILPCIPAGWKEFKINYLFQETLCRITVRQTNDIVEETGVTLDSSGRPDRMIQLVNDHQEHSVEVRIPASGMEKSMSGDGV
jgi:cyclic beta-1,2-glucan synthetase